MRPSHPSASTFDVRVGPRRGRGGIRRREAPSSRAHSPKLNGRGADGTFARSSFRDNTACGNCGGAPRARLIFALNVGSDRGGPKKGKRGGRFFRCKWPRMVLVHDQGTPHSRQAVFGQILGGPGSELPAPGSERACGRASAAPRPTFGSWGMNADRAAATIPRPRPPRGQHGGSRLGPRGQGTAGRPPSWLPGGEERDDSKAFRGGPTGGGPKLGGWSKRDLPAGRNKSGP